MQPDWNSLCGEVVLDSVIMTYRDEINILDQKYEKQTAICIMNILNFRIDCRKCMFKEIQHITTKNS